jgi:AcrR family transcriptional regulator
LSPSRRIQTHLNTCEEIKSIAWETVAEGGAAALSLGAIARKMSLTTPALYRYFKNRDALLSDLISDAYTSFTAALEESLADLSPSDHGGRFRRLFATYREWAVANPQKYFLMFGVPVPGYKLSDSAGEKADKSFLLLLEEVHAAEVDGKIDFSGNPLVFSPTLKERLREVKHHNHSFSERETYLALTAWSYIHGLVSLEISGGYSLILGDTVSDFFLFQVEHFIKTFGIK